jgi:AP-3 complex subunit beta
VPLFSVVVFVLEMVSPFLEFVDKDALSTASTLALRTLIQLNPGGYAKYIHLLAQSLGEIRSSPARAEIIWLVGEYASQLNGQAADALRLSLQDFAEQAYSLIEVSNNRMRMSSVKSSL